jgi:hypothetical protein
MAFAGRAGCGDAMNAILDEPVDLWFNGREVDAVVGLEGRGEGGDDAFELVVNGRVLRLIKAIDSAFLPVRSIPGGEQGPNIMTGNGSASTGGVVEA